MITTEYKIDDLTKKKVSIKTQKYYDDMPLGELYSKGYENNVQGRAELQAEVPQAQVNAVLAVWGDEPTVNDSSSE